MRRHTLPLLLALLLLFAAAAAAEGDNLLINGDFEILGEDGLPEGWDIDAYLMDGASDFSSDEQAHGGSRSARIDNYAANDARFRQTAEVEPETMYRLSGWICAEDIETVGYYDCGANLSILGWSFSDVRTEALTDTEGSWVYVEMYGETGPDQTEVTVCARLGGYSGDATGTARFDSLALEKVEELPDGVVADLWFDPWEEEGGGTADFAYTPPAADAVPARQSFRAWLYPVAVLTVILSVIAGAALVRKSDAARQTGTRIPPWIWAVTAAAFALRAVFAFTVEGYPVDMNCFRLWGQRMAQVGPARFYIDYFCDYPPLYMIVLGLESAVCGLFPQWGWLQDFLIKLVPMLCDLAIGLLIGREALRRGSGERKAGILTALVVFNPVLILNSACWGQVDSLLALLLLLIVLQAMRRNWPAVIGLFVAAVLTKPQALMAGPLGLAVLIREAVRDRSAIRGMLISALLSILAAFIIVLPFSVVKVTPDEFSGLPVAGAEAEQADAASGLPPLPFRYIPLGAPEEDEDALLYLDPFYIFTKYAEALSSYPYATLNTANLYYLFGLNWQPLTGTTTAGPPLVIAAVLFGWYLWLCREDRRLDLLRQDLAHHVFLAGAVLMTVFAVFGWAFRIPWSLTGYTALAACVAMAACLWLRGSAIDTLPLCGAILFMTLYCFSVKMHERYILPAIVLLALSFAVLGDVRQLIVMTMLSITLFLTEGIILDNGLVLGASGGHLNADTDGIARMLAAVNLLAVPLIMRTGSDHCVPAPLLPAKGGDL